MRPEIVKISSEKPESSLVSYAADQIRSGEVLGMPTDTFYGLAADPFNLRAVDRVYDIKTRSRHKPLSLLIESTDQAHELAVLTDEFHALANRFWPGPLTIIVKASARLPLKVTANTGNVALRVPSASIPLAVVKAAGIPITATSANLSGHSECTSAQAVRDQITRQDFHHCRWRPLAPRGRFYHCRSHRRREALVHSAGGCDFVSGDLRILRPRMMEAWTAASELVGHSGFCY